MRCPIGRCSMRYSTAPPGPAGSPSTTAVASASASLSMLAWLALLRQRQIGDLWTCALLDKPERREVDVSIDFVGFRIGDVFVAGYGIDHAEKNRHLPYIGVVD